MIADDTATFGDSKELGEENQERWRYILDRKEIKVSQSMTMHVCE